MQFFKKYISQLLVTCSLFLAATNLYATQLGMGHYQGSRPLLVASYDNGKSWSTAEIIKHLPDRGTLNFGHCSNGHCLVAGYDF